MQYDYVRHYTNARLIIRDDYQFNDGLFSGYDYKKSQYDKSSWFYQLDEQGNALRDDTLSHPRCVWNLLKAHVERYTPEMVNRLCGTSVADFHRICEILACVFRSIRSRIGIEVRSAIRIHSINRELNFFYRFLTRFFAAFHYRGIFPQ